MAQQIDFDPSVDYYKALGVSEKASADEIKKAYRKLAKQYHPDSTGGDKAKESRFKDVQNAYDVLSEPKKKALYDQIRAGGFPPPGRQGAPGQGFPGGNVYTYTSPGGGPGVFDLGDLFSQFFSNQNRQRVRVDMDDDDEVPTQRRRGGRARQRVADDAEFEQKVKASDGSWLSVDGNDVHSDVRISFDRAILGTVATVSTIVAYTPPCTKPYGCVRCGPTGTSHATSVCDARVNTSPIATSKPPRFALSISRTLSGSVTRAS